MTAIDIWLLVIAAVLVVVAGLLSSADAALSSFSKARARELAQEGRSGASNRSACALRRNMARIIAHPVFVIRPRR